MAWRFAVLFWTLFGVVTGIQVWISMITHGHSVPRLIFYYVAISEGWLAATVGIVWLARRFPIVPLRRLPILVHFLAACVIAVLHSFYWLGLLIAIRPYDRMTAEPAQMPIASILFFRVPLEFLLYCMVLGAAMAFDFYERYRERALQAAQLETSLADARLHALELQIQPHFLFNTLNAISGLVRVKRNDEAITMLAGLSELLRYTLDHENDQRVPLDVELAVLRRYLEIQRARFPDRMSFTIDASSEAGRGAVPTLLLQPLAENAIRHGIELSASPGVVNVRAFRNNGHLHIEVFNTGTLGERSESGIGVRNTLDRLRHLYGEEARFDLKSAGEGVLASVSIPWSSL
ncbi:MAG: histidine kinase [Acidobacteria bacterium]|nr:histidine kinase [Acidobacteriota bacterium]MBV9186681.1 histidine kinase [Acidobacteriota bacterium]